MKIYDVTIDLLDYDQADNPQRTEHALFVLADDEEPTLFAHSVYGAFFDVVRVDAQEITNLKVSKKLVKSRFEQISQ